MFIDSFILHHILFLYKNIFIFCLSYQHTNAEIFFAQCLCLVRFPFSHTTHYPNTPVHSHILCDVDFFAIMPLAL